MHINNNPFGNNFHSIHYLRRVIYNIVLVCIHEKQNVLCCKIFYMNNMRCFLPTLADEEPEFHKVCIKEFLENLTKPENPD